MPTNAEFKAELRDLTLARHIARSLGGLPVETLDQVDTYFRVASGRLKRREIRPVVAAGAGPGGGLWGADLAASPAEGEMPGFGRRTEYIHYHRSNDAAVRDSDYVILDEAAFRARYGEAAGGLEVWLTVRKRREIWAVRDTALHLDDVEGLGRFLEFEGVVLAGLRTVEQARATVAGLRDAFGPVLGEAVSGGYSDLLEATRE
jgi:adenylate cyclase class IV